MAPISVIGSFRPSCKLLHKGCQFFAPKLPPALRRISSPDARFEAVVVSVNRSDRSGDRRSDRAHSLRRMTDIGSDEHGLVRDSRLGTMTQEAVSSVITDMTVSIDLRARARGSRR
jgi:hypothetical protein